MDYQTKAPEPNRRADKYAAGSKKAKNFKTKDISGPQRSTHSGRKKTMKSTIIVDFISKVKIAVNGSTTSGSKQN